MTGQPHIVRVATGLAGLLVCVIVLLLVAAGARASFGFQFTWGSVGSADGHFDYPTGVTVDRVGDVYVTDYNHRVQKFSSDGRFLGKWGTMGTTDGQFQWPGSIAVDASRNVYVVDVWNKRIQKFDSNGTFLTKWSTYAPGDDPTLDRPGGITIDMQGNLWLVDESGQSQPDGGVLATSHVRRYDQSGNLLTSWIPHEADHPGQIAVDSNGFAYLTSGGNATVSKFTSSGVFVGKWGAPGTGNGEFYAPAGIAVDAAGDIYVTDFAGAICLETCGDARLQKFDPDGSFLGSWGHSGTGPGDFRGPGAIAFNAQGDLYIADTWNHRIQRFGDTGRGSTLMNPDTSGPDISHLRVKPRRWRVDRRGRAEGRVTGGSSRRRKRGTTFLFRLDRAVFVRYTIERRVRLSKKRLARCRARLKKTHARCSRYRYRNVGSFAARGVAGHNRKHFSGLIGRSALRAGGHRATLLVSDVDTIDRARVAFRVLKPRRRR